MKSGSLILATVVGACSLFGYGVSQAVHPVVENIHMPVIESAPEKSESDQKLGLRNELEAKYEHLEVTDEQLSDLLCGDANYLGQKDCYKGPTKDTKKYGSANVMMNGKPSYVRLVSMPGGAFLMK